MMAEGVQYKCGYCGWLLDNYCDNLAEHECFVSRNFDEEQEVLCADENNILTVMPKRYSNASNLSNEKASSDELLISEVAKRKALYDHRLPRGERTHLKVKDLWTEVYNILGHQHPISHLQKRWKTLRDEYVRCRKKMRAYKPSGTEGEPGPSSPSFRYYDVMTFLDDVLEHTPTISNVSVPEGGKHSPAQPRSSPHTPLPMIAEDSLCTPGNKKKKIEEQLNKAVLQVLQTEDRLDPIDGFLLRLGEGLRNLPYKSRSLLEIKFLTLLREEEEKLLE